MSQTPTPDSSLGGAAAGGSTPAPNPVPGGHDPQAPATPAGSPLGPQPQADPQPQQPQADPQPQPQPAPQADQPQPAPAADPQPQQPQVAHPIPEPTAGHPGEVVEVASVPVEDTDPTWDAQDRRHAQAAAASADHHHHGPRRDDQPVAPAHPAEHHPAQASQAVAHPAPAPVAHAAPAHEAQRSHDTGGLAAPAHHREPHHHAPAHHQAVRLVTVNAADLHATAEDLRRAAEELAAVGARLGTVRAGLGLGVIQGGVDEIVGRQVAELTGLAGELRDEAAELIMRAQLAEDDAAGCS